MRAALITGAGQVELREFPEPTPTETGVVVDVAYCGICGTDVHAYSAGHEYNPAICGHEWTGTVSAVGRSVSRFTEGDRVVVGVPPPCGSCAPCQAGLTDSCERTFAFARGRDPEAPAHGGFAPRIAVSADRVISAHPDLDDETLAQVEPVTVALHAVRRSGIRDGDVAVIQGAGPVGLTTMQCVRASGAGEVIVVEPAESRRVVAASLGATVVSVPDEADDVIRDRTGGLGADIVYECVGGENTVQSAVDLARRGGSVCLIGMADGDATIDPVSWLRKEITVTAALAYLHDEFALSMDMLADGRVRVDRLHTSTTQLDGLHAALDELAAGGSMQTKVLVKPDW